MRESREDLEVYELLEDMKKTYKSYGVFELTDRDCKLLLDYINGLRIMAIFKRRL